MPRPQAKRGLTPLLWARCGRPTVTRKRQVTVESTVTRKREGRPIQASTQVGAMAASQGADHLYTHCVSTPAPAWTRPATPHRPCPGSTLPARGYPRRVGGAAARNGGRKTGPARSADMSRTLRSQETSRPQAGPPPSLRGSDGASGPTPTPSDSVLRRWSGGGPGHGFCRRPGNAARLRPLAKTHAASSAAGQPNASPAATCGCSAPCKPPTPTLRR